MMAPLEIAGTIRRYARAERALCELSVAEYEAGITGETPESVRVNRDVIAAAGAVPRPLRWLTRIADWRIIRGLDYWRRTGQAS
jgi:hypothetical protein